MGTSGPVAILRESVERFLRDAYGDVTVDSDGDFVVRREGVTTWVRPLALTEEQTAAVIWSAPNVDMRVDADLTRFLATEAGNLSFGQFELHDSPNRVHISHALVGEFLSREELQVAVDAVSSAAAHYGPIIKERFGGRLSSEAAAGVPQEAAAQLLEIIARAQASQGAGSPSTGWQSQRKAERTRVVQFVFGFLGIGGGVAASIYAYDRTSSWALVIFVFLLTSYVIGRGVADVITDPDKVRRAVYFAIAPAVATGVLYLTFRWWDRWWLAVLLGLTVGVVIGSVLSIVLFPRIATEEMQDERERRRRFLGRR